MYVQFNIPDFILIFVPNIWESYQIGLLSLGPVEPRGGKGTISKMCVQFKTRLYCSTMRNLSLKLMLFTGSFRMNIKSKTVCTGINFHKCCLFVGVLGSDCSDFLFPPYILKHTVGVSGSLRFSGWPQASFQSMKAF